MMNRYLPVLVGHMVSDKQVLPVLVGHMVSDEQVFACTSACRTHGQ